MQCGARIVDWGLALGVLATLAGNSAIAGERPNVVLVISDDQGYGELSAHGNPVLRTPHLDRLHAESVRLTDFHVAPMCTPTRGQLMTGLDAFRNGAINVSSGRTLLRRELPTLPQLLADAGYRSGIFGKWHLGDAWPYRPEDRGFHEAWWFPSSHLGSVPDHWNNDYFDDMYFHQGRRAATEGYTTDVLFAKAIEWMRAEVSAGRPFFCYLPTAAPHGPYYVSTEYRAQMAEAVQAARDRLPTLPPPRLEQLTRYLAMIANLDDNVGRLEEFLREAGLRDNTIIVFLTDNGSTFGADYYPAGMKGRKTTLWEGGHRVPCFVHWPGGGLRPPGDVPGLTQVQDLLPTLLELCGVSRAADAPCDGVSLAGVLRGTATPPEDRMLVINYSRMPIGVDAPTRDNPAVPRREGAAVLWKRWRLLEDRELYDLNADPLQQRNVITEHPEVVRAMRAHLDAWWAGVRETCREFQPSYIRADAAEPTRLTACEWADVFIDQQAQVRRGEQKIGFWHVEVMAAGEYDVELRRWPEEAGFPLAAAAPPEQLRDGALPAGVALPIHGARLRIGQVDQTTATSAEDRFAAFRVTLSAGRHRLETWFLDADGQAITSAYYVTVRPVTPAR